ncbi:MAG: hypothetical protein AABX14_06005 [Candidatus Aenigmatarchaeota archaeon]
MGIEVRKRNGKIEFPFELGRSTAMYVKSMDDTWLTIVSLERWDAAYQSQSTNGKLQLNYRSRPVEVNDRYIDIGRDTSRWLGRRKFEAVFPTDAFNPDEMSSDIIVIRPRQQRQSSSY